MVASILERIRSDVRAMKPYLSARYLSTPSAHDVLLDANELPYSPLVGTTGLNRYDDQQPAALIAAVADFFGVPAERLLLSRGADEAIDILVRLFCTPGQDSILINPPAFPMYVRSAILNGSATINVPLEPDFSLDIDKVLAAVREDTKLVFVCSPHNPVGVSVPRADTIRLCEALAGRAIVVMDEAYIEYAAQGSCSDLIDRYENLIVLRTLSKALGLAGVRCGGFIARKEIVAEAQKVLAVYPTPLPVTQTVLEVLKPANKARLAAIRAEVLQTKKTFIQRLEKMEAVVKIYPTDTNFVLVQFKDAAAVDALARRNGFVLRNQSSVPGLANTIRITIGTPADMQRLADIIETGRDVEIKEGRRGCAQRKTKETAIDVCVDLDVPAPVKIATGIGFFDHMLEQIAVHGGFSLSIEALGDLQVDPHHTIEDVAITLGQALKNALGPKTGIERYGFTLPMDEALAQIAMDLGGRGLFVFKGAFAADVVGEMPTSLVAHFFRSLAENLGATIHLTVDGQDAHHQVEACFKVFARALRMAVRTQGGDALPSSKGAL